MPSELVERREQLRAEQLAAISPSYNPWLHLLCTTGMGLVALLAGLSQISAPTLLELLIVPVTLLFANGFEWRVHRDVLHRRRWPLTGLYDRHTPVHHMIYHHDDLAIRSPRELRLVLIPAAGVLGIVVATAPPALLVGKLLSANAGWLFLVTSALYMVSYELFHLAYHLPEGSFIGRLRLVRVLREHHARHHDPRLMQRWNFNVTLPLFDWLKGTIAPASGGRQRDGG